MDQDVVILIIADW